MKQFYVSYRNGMIYINGKSYLFENFVYGRIEFDEKTNKYPDYVHREVWKIKDSLNRICPGK